MYCIWAQTIFVESAFAKCFPPSSPCCCPHRNSGLGEGFSFLNFAPQLSLRTQFTCLLQEGGSSKGSWLLVIPLSELEWELEGGGGGLVSGTLAVSILTAATSSCYHWDLNGHLFTAYLLAAWLTLFLVLVGNPSSLLVLSISSGRAHA